MSQNNFSHSRNNKINKHTPLGERVRTGAICPAHGVWQVAGRPGHNTHFTRGYRMPTYVDRSVVWILIRFG